MPRTLAAALRHFVSSSSRERGESYFRTGRVSAPRSDATTFRATVRGTHLCDVSLTLGAGRLLVDCTCPYFEGSSEACKHIWAAMLAADGAHAIDVPPGLSLDIDDERLDVVKGDTLTRRESSDRDPPESSREPRPWTGPEAGVATGAYVRAGRARGLEDAP